jgi:hypothetical protein
VLRFAFKGGKIIEVDIIADPASLGALDLAVLPCLGQDQRDPAQ